METQWPLVIFTLFVCITCGLLGSMSILALKGRGRDLQMTGLITSAVCLVIGGIGAFLHLEHWERIFNGFGHITSGITQELVGCVALAVVMVLWFVVLRKGEDKLPTWLPVVTLIVAVAMVIATGHSYLMPARAAWGVSLIVFYLCNACMLGPIVLWAIAQAKGDTEAEGAAINLAFIGAALQLVGDAIYAVSVAMSSMPDHGYYADPTAMTTPPQGGDRPVRGHGLRRRGPDVLERHRVRRHRSGLRPGGSQEGRREQDLPGGGRRGRPGREPVLPRGRLPARLLGVHAVLGINRLVEGLLSLSLLSLSPSTIASSARAALIRAALVVASPPPDRAVPDGSGCRALRRHASRGPSRCCGTRRAPPRCRRGRGRGRAWRTPRPRAG